MDGGRETRRCTIKRVHAEIQRVLVGDVASYKQFCMALKACLRGGWNRGEGHCLKGAPRWLLNAKSSNLLSELLWLIARRTQIMEHGAPEDTPFSL